MFFAESVRNKSTENIWSLNPSWIPDFFFFFCCVHFTLSATFSVAEAISKEDLTYSLDWMTDPLTEDVLHMCKRVSNLTDNLLKTSVPRG